MKKEILHPIYKKEKGKIPKPNEKSLPSHAERIPLSAKRMTPGLTPLAKTVDEGLIVAAFAL